MMKTRQVLIIISFIIILSIIFFAYNTGYNSGLNYGEKNAEDIRLSNKVETIKDSVVYKYVNTKIVENADISNTIEGFGRVISQTNINISSEVQGKLKSNIALKKGSKFTQGQILFYISSNDIKLAIKAKKSAYLSLLVKSLPDLRIDFNSEYIKWEKFVNSINVNYPLLDLPEINSIKERNFLVSRSIIAEFYNIKSDEIRLNKYTIIAPFNGYIIDAFTDEGAIVNMGTPIINVVREGKSEVEISLSSNNIKKISIGSKVTFSDNNKIYQGKIIRIGNIINSNTQNLTVFASISPVSDDVLYDGMYLKTIIKCNDDKNVVKVPRKAIFNENTIYTVNEDSLLIPLNIHVISFNNKTVSASGIPDKTRIVVEPIINAKDSMKVWPL